MLFLNHDLVSSRNGGGCRPLITPGFRRPFQWGVRIHNLYLYICVFVYLCICVFVSTALFNEVFLPFNAFQFLPIITNPIQLEEEDDEVMIDPRYSWITDWLTQYWTCDNFLFFLAKGKSFLRCLYYYLPNLLFSYCIYRALWLFFMKKPHISEITARLTLRLSKFIEYFHYFFFIIFKNSESSSQ